MGFYEWLQQQQTRSDVIGKLAAHLLADPICPIWSNRFSTYRCYLVYRGAGSEEMAALEHAYLAWRRAEHHSAEHHPTESHSVTTVTETNRNRR